MSHFCLSFIIPSSESLDIGIEVRVTSDPRMIKGAKGKGEALERGIHAYCYKSMAGDVMDPRGEYNAVTFLSHSDP